MSTGKLVDSSQPSASVLFQRIQPTAAGRMPVSGDPLDDATIACVLAWIGDLGKGEAPASSPATSAAPSAVPTAPDGGAAPRPTVRVAAGATNAYTDKSGAVWSADTGFAGGKSMVESIAVSGTDDATLYDGQRWGQDPNSGAGTPFTYAFDLPDGDYQVTLKFAELFTGITAAGQRIFDVSIDGKAVLTGFDIFATAGGRNIAVDKSFAVTVGRQAHHRLRQRRGELRQGRRHPRRREIKVRSGHGLGPRPRHGDRAEHHRRGLFARDLARRLLGRRRRRRHRGVSAPVVPAAEAGVAASPAEAGTSFCASLSPAPRSAPISTRADRPTADGMGSRSARAERSASTGPCSEPRPPGLAPTTASAT